MEKHRDTEVLFLSGCWDVTENKAAPWHVYSVTPKPGRWDFLNIVKIHNKYQLLMVRFIKVIHPPRYGEI